MLKSIPKYLAVFDERFQRLVNQSNVVLVDVETEEAQLTGGRPANAVEEHERLRHQIVAVLIRLDAEEVLHSKTAAPIESFKSVRSVIKELVWILICCCCPFTRFMAHHSTDYEKNLIVWLREFTPAGSN